MNLNNEQLKYISKYFLKRPELINERVDLTTLLEGNSLFRDYILNPHSKINNLMLGTLNPHLVFFSYNVDRDYFENLKDHKTFKKCIKSIKEQYVDYREQERSSANLTDMPPLKYMPITPSVIKDVIEIDELFRLSKFWNDLDLNLYRGSLSLKKLNMYQLNSWSLNKEVADRFDSGTILTTKIGKNFPYLDVDLTQISSYNECEILLPPCDFETISVDSKINIDFHTKAEVVKVILKPLNFAREFLKCIDNLPEDYPKRFVTDADFKFKEAREILKNYVENYVNKKKIQLNNELIDEIDDQIIEFEHENAFNQE